MDFIRRIERYEANCFASFLELKYGGLHDAKRELGEVSQIREVFVGIQRYLFEKEA